MNDRRERQILFTVYIIVSCAVLIVALATRKDSQIANSPINDMLQAMEDRDFSASVSTYDDIVDDLPDIISIARSNDGIAFFAKDDEELSITDPQFLFIEDFLYINHAAEMLFLHVEEESQFNDSNIDWVYYEQSQDLCLSQLPFWYLDSWLCSGHLPWDALVDLVGVDSFSEIVDEDIFPLRKFSSVMPALEFEGRYADVLLEELEKLGRATEADLRAYGKRIGELRGDFRDVGISLYLTEDNTLAKVFIDYTGFFDVVDSFDTESLPTTNEIPKFYVEVEFSYLNIEEVSKPDDDKSMLLASN